jgi:hypothetical protein
MSYTIPQREALEGASRLAAALIDFDRTIVESASTVHWAVVLSADHGTVPIWPTVEGRCTCPAGGACRAAGRHAMVTGTRSAAHVGRVPNIDREALDRVLAWYETTPDAGVGIVVPDGCAAVRGVFGEREGSETFASSEYGNDETESLFHLPAGRVLPDDLSGGFRVRQPGDFMVAYSGARRPELGPVAFAPSWLERLTEPAPRAARDAELDLASPAPPVNWLCEGLGIAPGRPTVIAGFAGGGKSPLAGALAVSVAAGKPFLGMSCRQGRVLWCAFEAAPAAHRNLQRLARGAGVDAAALPINAWPWRGKLTEPGGMAELRRTVQLDGHALVVIDSYTSAVAVDHNSSSFGDVLRQLEKLSDETGATFVVLMHTAKKSEATGSRDVAGHFSAVASSQAVINLTRPDPERLTRFRLSCSRALHAPFDAFEVEFFDVHQNAIDRPRPSWGLRLRRCDEAGALTFVRELVSTMPGVTQAHVVSVARDQEHGRNETIEALKSLVASGEARQEKDGKTLKYWIAPTD